MMTDDGCVYIDSEIEKALQKTREHEDEEKGYYCPFQHCVQAQRLICQRDS